MDETARFALPQLAPGQLQKEFFHNEALQLVDLLLCPVIEGPALAVPPSNPVVGACYLVAAGASGAWAGHDDELAGYTEGGWRFVTPVEGMALMDRSSSQIVIRRNQTWENGVLRAQELRINSQKVIGERQPAISEPTGGTMIDAECRTVVAAMLTTLRTHGLIA